jgi:lipopolysaccharide/colanic/teichoic acid biosynthesis glycosyltransferase
MKRVFDIIISLIAIIFFTPLFLIISILIAFDSKGPVFYKSYRIGKDEKTFSFLKYRTMYPNSDKSAITIGKTDPRITSLGWYLRKYKLDELPQLWNVLVGHMSFVGPRPDVPKYINEYKKYLSEYYKIKPGITCYSTLYFRNESELYTNQTDPEQMYINKTIPKKVELDKKYIKEMNFWVDLKIIFATIYRIFKS